MKLKNKIAIITGGSSGIGKKIAQIFSREGAIVIIASRNFKKGKLIEKQVKNCLFIKTDIIKYDEVKRLVKSVIEKYKRIDILINNAGYIKTAPFEKTTKTIWDKTINTNLRGTFYLIKETIPHMKRQGYGKIINISSIAGIEGSSISASYAASKAGIIGLTKTLAKEYNKYNLDINAIAPGPTRTGMIKKIPKRIIEKIKYNQEILNEPEDIAEVALFLASDSSKNGEIVIIKGGKTIWQNK